MTGLFGFVSVALLFLYIRTLSPTIPLEDGGEMIRAACTLGVTHPPGYPLYVVIGRIMCMIPVGDPAFRMNLLSALFGAWACGIAACVVAELLRDSGTGRSGRGNERIAWFCGAFAGLLLGAGVGVWWQSVIAEKYTANLLLNAILAATIIGALKSRKLKPRCVLFIGFAFGISASHHGQTIYFAPAAIFAVYWLAAKRMVSRSVSRTLVLTVFLLVLGMSLKFVYPPVRSAQGPIHCWNDPHTFPRFVKYFSGNVYQHRVGVFDPAKVAKRLGFYFSGHVPNQFGLAGLREGESFFSAGVARSMPFLILAALCVWGFIWELKHRPPEFAVWLLTFVTGLAFCANFALTGIAIQTYYMPTFLVLCVWIGLGVARAAKVFGGRFPRLLIPAAGVLLAVLARVFWASGAQADRSRHYFAYDFSKALLATPAPGSILIPVLDYDMFPLWYVHDVLRMRRDVVLAGSLYKSPGWRDALAKRIRIAYPPGHSVYVDRLKSGESPVKRYLGSPIYFTLVYGSMEEAMLLPEGVAYRYVWREKDLLGADVMGERSRFKRWRTVRGCFDPEVPKDRNTRFVVGYWSHSDYRRAHVLSRQGRYGEAVELLRSVLAWPAFTGEPAGVHVLLGWCLDRMGRRAEALKEYETARDMAPSWVKSLRLLGTLYYDLNRLEDALRVFRDALKIEPDDPQIRRNVAVLERILSERGRKGR